MPWFWVAMVFLINTTLVVPVTGRYDKNVLLIVSDDLRPALGCYDGKKGYATPNIDQLAPRGALFEKAYAQTLGSLFAEKKCLITGRLSGKTDDWPFSWSRTPYHPSTEKYRQAKVCQDKAGSKGRNIVCPVDLKNQPEGTLPDIQTTAFAVEFLVNRTNERRKGPFFLAVGFHKPHIPLKYPKEFKSLYPIQNISLAPDSEVPVKLPKVAWNPWEDLRERDDVKRLSPPFPYGPLPTEYQKLVRQSYYGSVSYVDFLLGWLLSTLDALALSNSTIILFTSDHGWSLGEHGEWSKYSNFGVALNVPLIVYVPGLTWNSTAVEEVFPWKDPLTQSHTCPIEGRRKLKELTELVDILPSLVDIAQLPSARQCPADSRKTRLCTEGRSFFSLLNKVFADPSTYHDEKLAVFSQYPRPSLLPQLNSDQPKYDEIRVMGYSLISQQYHYIQWVPFDPELENRRGTLPRHRRVYSKELYDLRKDPHEDNNVAGSKRYKSILRRMAKIMNKGWRKAYRRIQT